MRSNIAKRSSHHGNRGEAMPVRYTLQLKHRNIYPDLRIGLNENKISTYLIASFMDIIELGESTTLTLTKCLLRKHIH